MFRRLVPLCAAVALLAACGGGRGASGEPETSEPAVAVDATDSGPAPAAAMPTVPTTAPASPGSTTESTPVDAPDTSTAAVVPAALQLSAPLVGGGEIELGRYAGRPVLLWFWAPW